MIKVMIVEDDLMVAAINEQFALKTEGVNVTATFHNGKDALSYVKDNDVDLILLDFYMPECNGLEFLKQLRQMNKDVDVIMITAANDMNNVKEALHLGIVDYLVKPFRYERFAEAMNKYLFQKSILANHKKLAQEDIDNLIKSKSSAPNYTEIELQKGIQKDTLQLIYQCMQSHGTVYLTSEQIAEETGLSKVTARRYMNYMIEQNICESKIDYSTGGRPRINYILKNN